MVTITGAVIARDEARNIRECLASLSWADEILVIVDGRTTDSTADVARDSTDRVFVRDFTSFPAQRNAALDLATAEWVLFLDADERVGPDLASEVRRVVDSPDPEAPVGFWVPRHNVIWGARVVHGGWYPDYQLRLLRRGRARYDEAREVHELVVLDGKEGHLEHPLIHENYQTVGQFLRKQRAYAALEARTLLRKGERPSPRQYLREFLSQPWHTFRWRYIHLQGYRSGWRGLLLSVLLAYYAFVTYVMLWRLTRAGTQMESTGRSPG